MRKILQILCIVTPVFLACNSNNKAEKDNQNNSYLDSIEKDSIEVAKKHKLDENKVIGGITFGISEADFQKQEGLFFKETKYKPWTNSDIEENKIGDYKFDQIEPFFYEKKLYQVIVDGKSIHYEKYDAEMNEQVAALKTMLVGKYGQPHEGDGLPEWHTTQKGYTYLVYGWQIGTKKIEMRIANTGLFYQLQLHIYQPSVVKTLEDTEANEKVKNAENAKDVL